MKIVINRCYGGFSLSHEGMLYWMKLKDLLCFYEEGKYAGIGTYWIVPPEQRPKPIEDWSKTSLEDRQAHNAGYSKASVYCRDIPRDDAALVKTVEDLGKQANGSCAELSVVEIPDGVRWDIDEYDGMEAIHEVHRSWS